MGKNKVGGLAMKPRSVFLLAASMAVATAYLEDKCRRKPNNPKVNENPKQYYMTPQRDDSLLNCTEYKPNTCCKPEAINYISATPSWPGGDYGDCPTIQAHLNCFPCSPKSGSAKRVCKTMCEQIFSKCSAATITCEPEPRTRISKRRLVSSFNSSKEACQCLFGDLLEVDNDDNDCIGYLQLYERNNPYTFVIWSILALILICGGAYLLFMNLTSEGEPDTPNPSAKKGKKIRGKQEGEEIMPLIAVLSWHG